MSEPLDPGSFTATAFAVVLQTTQAALYAFVSHLIGHSEDARDLVQEVYVDAWRATQHGRQPFAHESDAGARRRWLFHVAYHKAISYLRHHRAIPWESFEDAEEVSLLVPLGQ